MGKEVNVAVEIERGDFGFSVFQAGGELRYWNEAAKEDALAGSREHDAGLYDVGDASLDLCEVRPLEVTASLETLSIRLDGNTVLSVIELEDLPG